MANPFSAVPTAYRVHAVGRWWYGNCAWDAVGICAALHVDGSIESSCPDCELAHAWWADRLAADWQPHTRASRTKRSSTSSD
jgi:Alkylmercury lyase